MNRTNIPPVGLTPGVDPSQGNGNGGNPDGAALKVGFDHEEGMPLQDGTVVGLGRMGKLDGRVGVVLTGLARVVARRREKRSQIQCILAARLDSFWVGVGSLLR